MMRRLKRRQPTQEFTIDPIVLISGGAAFLALTLIGILNIGNTRFPTLTYSCFKFDGFLLIGAMGYIFSSWLIHDRRFVIKTVWGDYDGIIFLVTFGSTIGIQYLVTFMSMFMVTTAQVIAFYVSAAPSEELLFRGCLLYVILAFLIYVERERGGNRESSVSLPYWLKSVIAIAVSSTIFALAHHSYYADPPFFIGTLLSGIIFGVAFCASKGNLLITIIIHAMVNGVAAGNIVQFLFCIFLIQ